MAKKTILQLVKNIGVRIGSDEIDELAENTEVVDIHNLLQQAFEQIINKGTWEFLKNRSRTMDERNPGDLQINRLPFPADVVQLSTENSDVPCVRYRDPKDGRNVLYKNLIYRSPSDFLSMVQTGDENAANIDTILNPDGVPMLIGNDRAPTYYTSFDEAHLWFDSYDSSRGTGNLGSDTIIMATIGIIPDWDNPDAVLPIPERMETLVFEEAVVYCSSILRQATDGIAIKNVQQQTGLLRENEAVVKKDVSEINYGRKGRRGF